MPTRIRPAHPGVIALGVLTLLFLAFVLPPYLGLDPRTSQSVIPAAYPWYYPMLVTHIFLGSIALLAACLQLWPWLRRRYPVVHRRVGRTYLAAVALAGTAVLTITPVSPWGPNARVANTLLAVLWVATTIAGFRAAHRRRYAEHREWMIRSFALAFSIVTSRIWIPLCLAIFVPGVFTGGPVDEAALAQSIGVSSWVSWVTALLAAEWWLHRTRTRTLTRSAAALPTAPVPAGPQPVR